MNVEVVAINQEVSFEDGAITNYVTLRLKNGQTVRALVTDAGVAMLVAARQQQGGLAAIAAPPPSPAPAAGPPAPLMAPPNTFAPS